MINLETLNRKTTFNKPDNTTVLDLIKQSFSYKSEVPIDRKVLVTSEYVMRPDLISLSVYGSSNYLDYILKYNGISNPFSIDEYQILFIPDKQSMQTQFNVLNPDKNDSADSDDSKTEIKKTLPLDSNRIKYLTDIKDGRLDRNKAVAPNLTDKDQENVLFKDGKIIFGDNISDADSTIVDCNKYSTKAKIKEALLSRKTVSEKISTLTNVKQNSQIA